ncbi:MAG: bifunctional precorrin-2 dehydrogenase/sirohydrochlorin ferrochelatase [Oscillospiraceae bacterium]|nr:bifunctional precorrin-2 dehydrogenase/sirohydrochlorin ferrochelatase [Oscillospiraceae bacterium]
MAYFPIFVKAERQRALVFGNGEEAKKKLDILLDFGFDAEPKETFSEEMLSPTPTLVVVDTDDSELAECIYIACMRRNIPINTVDKPQFCSFYFSANIKTKYLTVGVSTGGMAPGATSIIRDRIKKEIPENIDGVIDNIAEIRNRAKEEIEDPAIRRKYLREKTKELLK